MTMGYDYDHHFYAILLFSLSDFLLDITMIQEEEENIKSPFQDEMSWLFPFRFCISNFSPFITSQTKWIQDIILY